MTLYALEASEAQKAAVEASVAAASDSSARERCFRISASAIKSKQCSGLIFYLSLNCFTYILLSSKNTFFFKEEDEDEVEEEDYDDDVLKTKQTKDLSSTATTAAEKRVPILLPQRPPSSSPASAS